MKNDVMGQSFKEKIAMQTTWLCVLIILALTLGGCQNVTFTTQSDTKQNGAQRVIQPIALATMSSASEIEWGQQLGSPTQDLGQTVAADESGNSYVAGFTTGDISAKNQGLTDILVAKFDASGKRLWALQNGTDGDESAAAMVLNDAGDIYITGSTSGIFSADSGVGSLYVQKISTDGKIQWTKQYGGIDSGSSHAIQLDSQGNIYLGGSTSGQLGNQSFGYADACILKLSPEGKILWVCQWGSQEKDLVKGLHIDTQGNLYAIGETEGVVGAESYGTNDIFLSFISPEGKVLKSYQYGSAFSENATSIVVNSKQQIYLSAWTDGDWIEKSAGQGDSVLLKVDSEGQVLWQKQFGTSRWDGIHGIILDKNDDDSVIVSGCENYDDCHAFLIKLDADGNMVWNKTLIPEFSTCGTVLAMDAKGNLYQTGGTHGQLYGDSAFSGTESDLFIYKLPTVR